MSTDATATPLPAGTRAAWLATTIGVPFYALLALAMQSASRGIYDSMAAYQLEDETLLGGAHAAVSIINVVTVVFLIALVSHTLGRVVFARTYASSRLDASLALATMGLIVSLPMVVLVAWGQGAHFAGAVYALLAITVPATLTAFLTRYLLPQVASAPQGARVMGVVAGVVVAATVVAVVLGLGL